MTDGPLTGIRVIEFTHAWAGPMCGRILADFGADVIKVESRKRLDITRITGPWPKGREHDPDAAYHYLEYNRNKRSINLELTDSHDLDIARRLVASADVVVENFAPGVLQKFGLDYESICERNSRVIMLSISGFGATGPHRSFVAFGQQVEAESGLMSITGYEGGPPLKVGVSYPDPTAAVSGVLAVMSALLYRDRTSRGQWIDLSMLETTASMLSGPILEWQLTGHVPVALGNRSCDSAPHGIYPCRGADRWIALEVHGEMEWQRFQAAVGLPWVLDPHYASQSARLLHSADLDGEIRKWTGVQDADELAEKLRMCNVRAPVVATIADLMRDPHLRDRGFWIDFDTVALGRFRSQGLLAKLHETPGSLRLPPPRLGEHGDEILAELGTND